MMRIKLDHVVNSVLSYGATAYCDDCLKEIPARMTYAIQQFGAEFDPKTLAKLEITVDVDDHNNYYVVGRDILCAKCYHARKEREDAIPNRS